MALFRYLTKGKKSDSTGPDFDKTRELLDKGNSPSPSKRGSYKQYSPKLRCEIGKYATDHIGGGKWSTQSKQCKNLYMKASGGKNLICYK